MKNTLADLQNHLFTALERLGNEDLKGDALKVEISRAMAVKEVGKVMVDNAQLALDAEMFLSTGKRTLPRMLDSTGKSVIEHQS